MPPAVYTDYQYGFGQGPFLTSAPQPYFSLISNEIMSPSFWTPVLRQDANALESSSTYVKRMQMNLRYSLGASNWVQITTFLVTIRKDATNRVPNQQGLTEGDDYIYSPTEQLNVRLNPSVFKVLYTRSISLMAGAWKQEAFATGGETLVAQSTSTFAKGQVNIKPNMKIRQPLGTSWKLMDQSQFGPSQRYFLLSFFKGQTAAVDDDPPGVDADILFTCYNSG